MGAADDLFAELDRMAEKIGGEEARARAAESMGNLDLDEEAASDFDRELGSDPPPPDVDRRLEELKRRMGRD
jgi:phage shock protein A